MKVSDASGALATLALAGTLALLAGLPAPETADAAPKLRCPGAGGKTVLRTAQVRIFTLPSRFSGNPDYFGCLYRAKRAFRISVIDYYGVVVRDAMTRLAGRYVVLAQDVGSADLFVGETVVVRDLATGRAVYTGPQRLGGTVRDIVIKPNGATAFAYETMPSPPPPGEQPGPIARIHVATATDDRIVDRGRDVDATSLELSPDARSVTYVKAGEQRWAPIP